MSLSWQRWQVALAIRDGRWWRLAAIQEAVGFDPLPCLMDEMRGAKNFAKSGDRWRLRDDAAAQLAWHETTPRKSFTYRRPKARQDAMRQGELFA